MRVFSRAANAYGSNFIALPAREKKLHVYHDLRGNINTFGNHY
jgi:hypothetical protein